MNTVAVGTSSDRAGTLVEQTWYTGCSQEDGQQKTISLVIYLGVSTDKKPRRPSGLSNGHQLSTRATRLLCSFSAINKRNGQEIRARFPSRPYFAGWALPTKKPGPAPDMAAASVTTSADQNIGRTAELHAITASQGLLHDLDVVHKNPVGRVLHPERARAHTDAGSGGSGGARIKTHAQKGDRTAKAVQ